MIKAEGFGCEQCAVEFFRFVLPAIASGDASRSVNIRYFEWVRFRLTEPVEPAKTEKI